MFVNVVADEVEENYEVVSDLTAEFDEIFNREIYKDYAEIRNLLKQYEQVRLFLFPIVCVIENWNSACGEKEHSQ